MRGTKLAAGAGAAILVAALLAQPAAGGVYLDHLKLIIKDDPGSLKSVFGTPDQLGDLQPEGDGSAVSDAARTSQEIATSIQGLLDGLRSELPERSPRRQVYENGPDRGDPVDTFIAALDPEEVGDDPIDRKVREKLAEQERRRREEAERERQELLRQYQEELARREQERRDELEARRQAREEELARLAEAQRRLLEERARLEQERLANRGAANGASPSLDKPPAELTDPWARYLYYTNEEFTEIMPETIGGATEIVYNGVARGQMDGTVLQGTVTLRYDLAGAKVMNGQLKFGDIGSLNMIGGAGTPGDLHFDATLEGTLFGGDAEGWLEGSFFGPRAEEAAGFWGATGETLPGEIDGEFAAAR